MSANRQRISKYLTATSLALLFAGLCGLAAALGINEKGHIGVGLGLVAAGLALSLAATEFLRQGKD